jgi:TolA-binding protein
VHQKFAFVILFLCVGTTGFCQFRATERSAFKNLSRQRWEKTKQLLDKGLQKDSVNAALKFIYARYYFHPANPAYHIDSANLCLIQARSNFDQATAKEKERWRRGALDTLSMEALRKKIDSSAFEHAKVINTEGAFLHFLSIYPKSDQRERATALRDEAAYLDAVKVNTYQSFLAYLEKYPASSKTAEARKTYERLLFESHTSARTLESYQRFLTDFPASPYRRIVEKNIFEIFSAPGDRQSFEQYVTQYPYSTMTQRACNILFYLSNEIEAPLYPPCSSDSILLMQSINKGIVVPVLQNSKYGFMNDRGEMLIKPGYDSLTPDYECGNLSSDLLIADRQLISRAGASIVADSVTSFDDLGYGFVQIETPTCKRVIHKSGFGIGECIEGGKIIGKRFLGLKRNNVWGLFTFSGRALTLFEFDDIEAHGEIIIFRKGSQSTLATASEVAELANAREMKFSAWFDEVKPWSSEWLWAKSGEFEGVFNQQLNPVINFDKHVLEREFFGAVARSAAGHKLYDSLGEELAASKDVVIHEPWIVLVRDGDFTFYRIADTQTIRKSYDTVSFLGPFALAFTGDSVIVHFAKNKWVAFPAAMRAAFVPGKDSTAFLQIAIDKRKTIYDQKGKKLFSFEYDNIQYAGSGFFIFSKKDKKGLVNLEGKVVLQPEYDAMGSVVNHVVTYLKKMKFGAYHTVLKQTVKPTFEKNLALYTDSWLIASEKGYFGFVDWKAKPISNFEFDEIQYWNDSAALVKKKSDWFIYDIRQKKNVESNIKQIEFITDTHEQKLCIMKQGDFFGVVSNTKGFIIPPSFTKIVNVGNREEPLYFTEKHVEEALLFVVIYYDQNGKLLYRQVYEEADYERILCRE